MKEIADYAFSSWYSLEEVVFESIPERIGEQAFSDTNLGNISIGEGLVEIARSAFNGSGAKLSLPKSLTTIGDAAFYNMHYEKECEVTFPNGMDPTLESQITTYNLWGAKTITVVYEDGSSRTYNKRVY